MEKSEPKKHYWGVIKQEKGKPEVILFSGSYRDCWEHLVTAHSTMTLHGLCEQGIKITRIN